MDPEAFLDIANQVIKLKMFPYFDIAYCVLCALSVREDLGSGNQIFSRKHPLACWLSYMLVVFAGGMLCNALLAEPILAPLKNTPQVIVACLVWYVIFYTPADVGYKLAKFLPIKVVCSAMKEIYRCKKVYDGVAHAAKLYPNAVLIMIIIGTIKGNGAGFVRLLERLIRGVWTPTAMEFMQPTFYTKASLVASIIFVLDKKTDLISAPHALVYFGIVIFFVYFKLSSILLGIHDPFVPFENLMCALFFGGIWDSLAKILGRGQVKEEVKDVKRLIKFKLVTRQKYRNLYIQLLQKIKQLIPGALTRTTLTDFESAMISVLSQEFLQSNHRGCFYISVNVYIEKFSLQARYTTDADFALKLWLLPALAFVPLTDVVIAFGRL